MTQFEKTTLMQWESLTPAKEDTQKYQAIQAYQKKKQEMKKKKLDEWNNWKEANKNWKESDRQAWFSKWDTTHGSWEDNSQCQQYATEWWASNNANSDWKKCNSQEFGSA